MVGTSDMIIALQCVVGPTVVQQATKAGYQSAAALNCRQAVRLRLSADSAGLH